MGTPIRLALIIGSTREGRFADTVATWFHAQASQHPELAVDLIDLAEWERPAPTSSSRREFAERVDAAEAFVVITPEYNHGYPAPLKAAIDSVREEWFAKPVGFVSYGGVSGGVRAVEQLRQVFAELHTTTVRETVSFHGAGAQFDETGAPHDQVGPAAAAKVLLDQLIWWGLALRDARAARPYRA